MRTKSQLSGALCVPARAPLRSVKQQELKRKIDSLRSSAFGAKQFFQIFATQKLS